MAKDPLAIPSKTAEGAGMDDSIVIDTPDAFLAARGVINIGPGLQRVAGKVLYKYTRGQPVLNIALAYGAAGPGRAAIGVWVQSRTKLVLFTTIDDFNNVGVVFP